MTVLYLLLYIGLRPQLTPWYAEYLDGCGSGIGLLATEIIANYLHKRFTAYLQK